MKRVAIVLGVLCYLGGYPAAHAGAVSCAQANSSISISVCNSPELKALDTELDTVYETLRAKMSDHNAVTYSQRRWVNTVLNRCKTEQCLEQTYQKRIQALKQWADVESSPDQALGRYSMTRFNMVFRGDAYGWTTLETQDCLSVQKGQADQYAVQLALTPKQSDQQCALGGTYVARGAYLERVPDGASSAGAVVCALQIHPMKHSLQIKDPQGACQQLCGANLPLDGVEFLRDQTGINACHAPKRTVEPLPAQ